MSHYFNMRACLGNSYCYWDWFQVDMHVHMRVQVGSGPDTQRCVFVTTYVYIAVYVSASSARHTTEYTLNSQIKFVVKYTNKIK